MVAKRSDRTCMIASSQIHGPGKTKIAAVWLAGPLPLKHTAAPWPDLQAQTLIKIHAFRYGNDSMMSHLSSVTWCLQRPRLSLVLIFISWKLLLLFIACTSPYPGYDTSTTLLFSAGSQTGGGQHIHRTALKKLAGKLTRWDAIYFSQIAHRGAIFEQEWAFGWGFARLLQAINRGR